jgi:hypothetical protein
MSKVFVRWYNEVVEGTIVKEDDMFGMTVVEIPVQGMKVKALYSPKHIYKTVKEACGEYPKTFPTPETFQHPSFANVGATVSKAIDDAKEAYGEANKIVMTLNAEAEQLDDVEQSKRDGETNSHGSNEDDGLFRTYLTLEEWLVDELTLIGCSGQRD